MLDKYVKFGILLMGTTGSGKSTLANAFSATEVEAEMEEEWGDLRIKGVGISEIFGQHTKIPRELTKILSNPTKI